jgi:hypothetical protein
MEGNTGSALYMPSIEDGLDLAGLREWKCHSSRFDLHLA